MSIRVPYVMVLYLATTHFPFPRWKLESARKGSDNVTLPCPARHCLHQRPSALVWSPNALAFGPIS